MKFFLTVIIFFLCYLSASSQNTFQKSYGNGLCSSAHQTSDNGFILSGVHLILGIYNSYLIKTDENGDTLWTRTYLETAYPFDHISKQTDDGGYVLAGSYIPGNVEDVYLIKTDGNGDTLWTRLWHQVNKQFAHDLIITNDGGYAIVGQFMNPLSSSEDIFIIRTNSSGDTLWTKSYSATPNDDLGQCIRQTSDGGFIIAGHTNANSFFDADYFLLKIDSAGNVIWSKIYGTVMDEYSTALTLTNDGGYLLLGKYNCDMIRTDSIGNILWSKYYGGGVHIGYSVVQTNDSNFIIAGAQYGLDMDAFLVKINPNGDTIWTKAYGQNNLLEEACSVSQTSDNGFIIAGSKGDAADGIHLTKVDSTSSIPCNLPVNVITVSPLSLIVTDSLFKSGATSFTIGFPVVNYNHVDSVRTLCNSLSSEEEEDNSMKQFSIFPNPATDQILISCSSCSIKEIQLYNLWGQIIFSSKVDSLSNTHSINCLQFPKGIYFVKATTNSGSVVKKVVIQ